MERVEIIIKGTKEDKATVFKYVVCGLGDEELRGCLSTLEDGALMRLAQKVHGVLYERLRRR